jgi:DNA-binding transcriptional regulator GbsR (MarR family)
MNQTTHNLKQEFSQGLSQISNFWGFPKGMGAIFAMLYLSPTPLSLDELVLETGLTKGAVSTNVRALARLGLVHPFSQLGDRKDYYSAETDFYKSIRIILKERQNNDFKRALDTVNETIEKLEADKAKFNEKERAFLLQRLLALQSFFDALDRLVNAIIRLDGLGGSTINKLLAFLK